MECVLGKEEPDVALRFGCPRQGLSKGLHAPAARRPRASCTRAVSRRISTELPALPDLSAAANRRSNRLVAWTSAPLSWFAVLREDQTYEGEVVELAQIAGVIRDGHASVRAQSAASDSFPCAIQIRALMAGMGRTSGKNPGR